MANNTLSEGLSLTGKSCIVTGAASDIGEAVARVHAANGAKVAMVDVDRARPERVAAEIAAEGGIVLPILADVCEAETVRAFFRQTQVTLEEWNKTIGPNLTAVFLCCREAFLYIEQRPGGGRIINMGSSSTGVASGPGHSPDRASKHGVLGFSKNILLEGMHKTIGVTVLNPGHVKTPMTEIIDKGLHDGDLPAYVDGWLDEKAMKEGIHASCIEVDNVAWLTLYVATRTPDVTIPTVSFHPTHKAQRYGMEV